MNVPWYLQEHFAPARPQDLVLWLHSSSVEGTTWRNLASNYANLNHGQLVNGVAIGDLVHPSGVFGAPCKFDGVNQYANCGNDASLNTTDAITIEAWVKSAITVSGGDNFKIWHFYADTNNRFYLAYPDLFTDKMKIFMKINGDPMWGSSMLDPDLNWHHCVFVWDRTNLSYCIDGNHILSETGKDTNDFLGTPTFYVSNSADAFNGFIDFIRIYNCALSASEISHNHTHSPIYYMQHGIDPLDLIQQTSQEVAHVVA